MPIVDTPPDGAVDAHEGTIAGNGEHVTLPADSAWLVGDPQRGTPPIQVGDIVLFKNSRGMAMQVVTNIDPTHIHFNNNDWFNLNQRGAQQGTIMQLKDSANPSAGWAEKTSLFRLLMVTYYVDAATTPGAPRLMRVVNNFTPQALAGVIEDLDFTYDLVDGTNNPAAVTGLPYTDDGSGLTYTSNQIRKVNIHVGVRSESTSRGTGDYVRNHISTAVDVRSLASVDRYVSQ